MTKLERALRRDMRALAREKNFGVKAGLMFCEQLDAANEALSNLALEILAIVPDVESSQRGKLRAVAAKARAAAWGKRPVK